jgi:type I restriction enzyme S subunit
MSDRNGDLPNGWVQATIAELCDLNPKHDHALSDETPVSFVPMAAVSDVLGTITELQVRTLGEIRKGYTHFSDGDVIFAKITPCMENGKAASVRGMTNGLACGTTEFYVFRSRGAIDQDFLFHFVRQESYRKAARATMQSGVGQARVPKEFVLNTELPLPPLAEQQRIVAKIDALQERSRRAHEALSEVGPLLEQFRQSVLITAFRGDLTADWRAAHADVEPASELLYRIRAERRRRWEQAELAKYEAKGRTPPKNWQDKYEEPEPVDDSVLPELPNGWEWVRVKDIGEVQLGRQRAPQYHSGPNMRPYLRVMNVFEDRIDTEDIMKMDFSPEEFERYRLEPGDILLNEGQSRELVGRSAIYRGEIPGACFTNTLVRFRPDTPIESDYPQIVFLGYLKTGRFQQLASLTVNIAHLGAGRFADMEFPLPPLEEQAEIVRRARGALNQITRLEERLHTNFADLDQLDQSILTKAFRGELVPQDPNDEPASALLARIREQRMQQTEAAKHKQKTATPQLGNRRSEESSRPTPQQLTLAEMLLTKD